MTRSPTRWLAALAVLSGLLTSVPLQVAAQRSQTPPNQTARQTQRVPVPTVDMPNLVGLSLQAAQQQSVVVKFRLSLVAESIDSTRPPGTIVRQSVPAGQPVRAGTRVVVYLAEGGVTVPPVEGQTLETARPLLRKLGFDVEVSETPTNRLRRGIVNRQDPKAGTVRPRGSVVRLQVAVPVPIDPRESGGRGGDVRPADPPFTVVPDVVDLDERTALARLSKSRLEGRVRRSRSRDKPGIVLEQTPKEGARVAPDSVVIITVSIPFPVDPVPPPDPNPPIDKPPDDVTVPVPDLVGMRPDQAGPVLSGVGLRGRLRYLGLSRAAPGAVVVEQDPGPGKRVRPGALVDLVIAAREQPPQPPPPPPPTQYMPDLVGRTPEDAMADATVRKLRLKLTPRDDPMANGRPGVIVRQSVAASAPIDAGSPVTVWVATGVVVPELVGLSADAARQQLAAKGLQARASDVVRDRDAGTVVDQSPKSRAVVPRGAAVEFSVAVLAMVRVPDVGGRDRRDALGILAKSRLTGDVSDDEGSTLTPGLVSGQDPRPGAEVPVGATVRVRVASGVVVPSVVGTTPSEARARLASSGLTFESRDVRTDRSGANTVFTQLPGAGQRVARGTAVLVSVALPPLVTVPDVRGRQRGEAAGALTAAKLRSDITNDPAAALAPGLVSAQVPGPGSQVDAGTIVRLQVAVGVVVPSVVGTSANEAQARVASVGLRANVREVRTDTARAGTVYRQLPAADERVARGTVVELSLARPPLVTVPDLAQRSRAEAESITQAARLAVAFDEDPLSPLPPDRVSRQDPAPGASIEVGETVRVVLATGVLVPSVVQMPIRSARASLEKSGLRVEERGEVTDGVPESAVLRQSPESNARVAVGSLVRLVIAVRRTVTVPDLQGREQSEVEPLLAPIPLAARFEEAATAEAGVVAGTVVQQIPAAGTVVGAGTAVRVILARAQGTAPPPSPPPTPPPAQVPPPLEPDGRTSLLGTLTYFLRNIDPLTVFPWIAGIGLFSLVAYRFVKANRGSVNPAIRLGADRNPPEAPPTPAPHVNLHPHVDEMTTRLEVSGPALIQFEVRIRAGAEPGEQSLSADGQLTGEERRLYE